MFGAQLGSQPPDVHIYSAGAAEIVVPPYLLKQVGTGEHPAGVLGELSIDEATYTARLRSRVLDLTFKEFELLKFLAQHPGRVFTRAHLLQEVWGYDYFGGTRTVDVHVRRLRAKLGAEHESLIGTVRNVGYRFVPLKTGEDNRRGAPRDAGPATGGPPTPSGPPTPGGQADGGQADGGPAGGDARFAEEPAASLVPGTVQGG